MPHHVTRVFPVVLLSGCNFEQTTEIEASDFFYNCGGIIALTRSDDCETLDTASVTSVIIELTSPDNGVYRKRIYNPPEPYLSTGFSVETYGSVEEATEDAGRAIRLCKPETALGGLDVTIYFYVQNKNYIYHRIESADCDI